MKVLLVSLCERKLSELEFILPVEQVLMKSQKKVSVVKKHYTQVTSKDVSGCDKVIISGNPLMDNSFANDVNAFIWLNSSSKPVLGICAGMQAIALSFCLRLHKSKEIGMVEVSVVKKNRLFEESFTAYSIHSRAVEENPNGFEVLARSKACIHAMKHKDKEIYGVLFHPEVRNSGIILKFLEI